MSHLPLQLTVSRPCVSEFDIFQSVLENVTCRTYKAKARQQQKWDTQTNPDSRTQQEDSVLWTRCPLPSPVSTLWFGLAWPTPTGFTN